MPVSRHPIRFPASSSPTGKKLMLMLMFIREASYVRVFPSNSLCQQHIEHPVLEPFPVQLLAVVRICDNISVRPERYIVCSLGEDCISKSTGMKQTSRSEPNVNLPNSFRKTISSTYEWISIINNPFFDVSSKCHENTL